ncbi:MAG: DUF4197 domain-containing protein [Crocinitomicaceae bacterium]|jgi:hypothetical protein|nr:DUF4197 domain-containing protein [Crocinitomicaceae bacterium]MBT6029409.1 DUF4197 domain-containing protein [Crocinitomicaceae bacterium]
MKKSIYTTILIVLINSLAVQAQISKLKKGLEKSGISLPANQTVSEEEVGNGLKEALNNGIEKGVKQLSIKDGYFKDEQIKLLMPEEALQVESKLRKLGQGSKVDAMIESMNRAAEDAASSSKELFVSAIKNLSVNDAMSILKGEDNAATVYLSSETRTQLIAKFKPIIKTSLDKVGATKHWTTVFNSYNKIPMVQKVNPDLVGYATDKAIDGLFIQIAKEELEIRKNPAARVTDLLKKVFK